MPNKDQIYNSPKTVFRVKEKLYSVFVSVCAGVLYIDFVIQYWDNVFFTTSTSVLSKYFEWVEVIFNVKI